MSHSLS